MLLNDLKKYSELHGMYRFFVVALLLVFQPTAVVWAVDRSSTLYSEVEKSIYQIRVVNRKTGHKRTIGSGFVVARPNVLATNYHVISAYANDPDAYQLDYLATNGDTGSLQLLDVDVLHDLAVLSATTPLGKPLQTALIPEKGAALYAFGNPLDLGFSVVPGTNNGILTNSEDNNILFSGNLNSGMSGGPTLDEKGSVVGVNVATAGNDVSFLVSVQYLNILLERLKLRDFAPGDDLHGAIVRQLHDNSLGFVQRLSSNEWETVRIGGFDVPSRMDKAISCWDGSRTNEERGLVSSISASCSNERDIYLDEKLSVGNMQYQYTWYETDSMIPPRFYRMYETQNSSGLDSTANKESVTDFNCHTGFVDVSGKDFKMTVCRRDYLRYTGLSDMLVTGAMVSEKRRGLLFELSLFGTDFNSASKLLKRMLGAFKWQP